VKDHGQGYWQCSV